MPHVNMIYLPRLHEKISRNFICNHILKIEFLEIFYEIFQFFGKLIGNYFIFTGVMLIFPGTLLKSGVQHYFTVRYQFSYFIE